MIKITRKTLFTSAFILLFMSLLSEAADWLYFIENTKGDKYFIDIDSIKQISSDMVRITEKTEFKDSSSLVTVRVRDAALDCREKRIRVLRTVNHYQNGETRTSQGDEEWQNVNAEDIEESMLELVCSLKKAQDKQ